MNRTENCKAIGARRENIAMMINKFSEDGVWDAMRAKDVPDEIVRHVLAEIDLGKDPSTVRREMGIKSQTSKEWQKISAAIKQGYRVNTTTYFHKLFSRSERLGEKLFTLIDTFLDQDIEQLEGTDKKGVPILDSYVKSIVPMIDALNRLQQGQIKNGKDLGVFADPSSENKGGGGTTIIVKSHIVLPTQEELKKRTQKTIEAEVVGQEELPK